MNPKNQEIHSLLRSTKNPKRTSNICPEVIYIREIMKGPSLEQKNDEIEEVSDDDSSSEEKVIDVKSHIDELMKARQERGLPVYVQGPKKGNLMDQN